MKKILLVMAALALLVGVGAVMVLVSGTLSTTSSMNNTGDTFPNSQDSSAVLGGGTDAQPTVTSTTSTTQGTSAQNQNQVSAQYTHVSEETMTQILQYATSSEYENEYTLADTDLYTIYVISHAQFFNVILKQFPYREGQEAAEAYLAEVLGVSRADLCGLNIDVFAPAEFDPSQATDLGLSECPGPRAPGNV